MLDLDDAVRLEVLEAVVKLIAIHACVNAPPEGAAHMKRTLWRDATKVNLSTLPNLMEVQIIQMKESLLRKHMHALLSEIEQQELAAREKHGLPAGHREIPEIPES